MKQLNEVTLIGNLTRAPEARVTPNGNPASKITIATNRTYTNSEGQEVTETQFIPCEIYGANADFVNRYMTTGRYVYFRGRLQISSYEKNGETRYFTSVVGRLDPLDKKPESVPAEQPAPEEEQEYIPF